jgi:two-component system, OmpR family, KDP operon response regulator KdpE
MGYGATRVLLVGDARGTHRFLARALSGEGYDVETASGSSEATTRAGLCPPDAVILELADGSALDLCRELRTWSEAALVLLSPSSDVRMVVAGLDAGADVFLETSVSLDELKARLRAVLRRVNGRAIERVVVGDLAIDLTHGKVALAGREVDLTRTEYRILRLLASKQGKLVAPEAMLTALWGPRHYRTRKLLHVHVSHLRQKIEPDPASPRYIITKRGVGLRLAEDPAAADRPLAA